MSNAQRCKLTYLDRETDIIAWREADGWHGCLRHDRIGNTDFCGPFAELDQCNEHLRNVYHNTEGICVT